MKVIIPVAGAGTRLRPHTYTQPKPLMPVAGKPIIRFIIDKLVEAGIDDFVFVIGYLGEKIRDYIESAYPDLKTEFVYQESRKVRRTRYGRLGKRLKTKMKYSLRSAIRSST